MSIMLASLRVWWTLSLICTHSLEDRSIGVNPRKFFCGVQLLESILSLAVVPISSSFMLHKNNY